MAADRSTSSGVGVVVGVGEGLSDSVGVGDAVGVADGSSVTVFVSSGAGVSDGAAVSYGVGSAVGAVVSGGTGVGAGLYGSPLQELHASRIPARHAIIAATSATIVSITITFFCC